jgi:hypothetical protein
MGNVTDIAVARVRFDNQRLQEEALDELKAARDEHVAAIKSGDEFAQLRTSARLDAAWETLKRRCNV